MATITISNQAGGDAREFQFNGRDLSDRAIRWADHCDRTFGGVSIDDERARALYDQLVRDRMDYPSD